MNEQDKQTVERVAAALWKAETIDSGAPQSVIDARTPELFVSQSDGLRAKWHKFARAAISAMPDTTAQADTIKSLTQALNYMVNHAGQLERNDGIYWEATEIARAALTAAKEAL